MYWSIFFEGEKLGELSYESLAAFGLFCERHGLNRDVVNSERKLEVYHKKHRDHLILENIIKNDLNKEVYEKLTTILKSSGIDLQADAESPTKISIRAFERTGVTDDSVKVSFPMGSNERLKNLLLQEFNKSKINYEMKEYTSKEGTGEKIIVAWELPAGTKNSQAKEKLITALSRIMIRFHKQSDQNQLFSFMPSEMIKNWLSSVTNPSQKTNVNEVADSQKIQPQKQKEPAKEKVTSLVINKADVFMAYNVIPPKAHKEDKEYLIFAEMIVKNTGTTPLGKPVLCLKVSPANYMQIQGQAIPEKMIDVLATHSSSGGEKGWKYVYSDWQRRIKEKGEYWITPIQEVKIPPNESLTYSFKMFFTEPIEKTEINVSGFAYFNEGKDQFAGNNQISFSF
ncbi:hypothetical protein FZC79_07900 [Rossellomorea vietnamensis]|uniref:Uncharacterized protein n=1 Tax=Rossellomorea vietnamensis TaxID=218284 RepID=A0A5D4KFK4_9BACI|nr:hypothetical protein [Rossellomorea vietnamensis]TYR76067.1 hypothetical protein FZC79_07900 [Rossellomorea vietnamensis]